MTSKGPPPPALQPHVARKLLDLLSSDDDFRDLFRRDAHAALLEAGHEVPAGTPPSAATCADCMQLGAADRLASKERIARDRDKLEHDLALVQRFEPLAGLKSD